MNNHVDGDNSRLFDRARNHVDGEIHVPDWAKTSEQLAKEHRVPSAPSDLEYRTVALNASVQAGGGRAATVWIVDVAKGFENYLRHGDAA